MPLLGRECGIFVNGTGLAAQTVSLAQENTSSQRTPIGYNTSYLNSVNGGILNQIDISYIPDMSKEPIYWNFSGIKTNFSGTPISLNFAGLTGLFYLKSLNFNVNQNQPIIFNASLVNFSNITGNYTGNLVRSFTGNQNQIIPHGWSASIKDSNNNNLPIFSLDYSFEIEYNTLYRIGQKAPFNVVFNRGIENINITYDRYTGIDFYGMNINTLLNGGINIALNNLSNISGSYVFNFPLTGAKVTKISQDSDIQGFTTNQYTINNIY